MIIFCIITDFHALCLKVINSKKVEHPKNLKLKAEHLIHLINLNYLVQNCFDQSSMINFGQERTILVSVVGVVTLIFVLHAWVQKY